MRAAAVIHKLGLGARTGAEDQGQSRGSGNINALEAPRLKIS